MKPLCLFLVAIVMLIPPGRAQSSIEGRVILPQRPSTEVMNKRYELSGRQAIILPDPPAAVVYLEGKFPKPSTTPKASLLQEDFDFIPRLLPVRIGTVVEFPNRDKTYHSIFSFSKPKHFDLGRYRGDEVPVPTVTFDQPGPVVLRCDIHEHMRAIILVLDSPYFVRTDGQGLYQLSGLPAGSYVLKAWLSDKEILGKAVELKKGATLHVDFP
jgi:plastocyanin